MPPHLLIFLSNGRENSNVSKSFLEVKNNPYTIHFKSKIPLQGFTTAHQNTETCLLWVDAHADINTMENSDSGTLHILRKHL